MRRRSAPPKYPTSARSVSSAICTMDVAGGSGHRTMSGATTLMTLATSLAGATTTTPAPATTIADTATTADRGSPFAAGSQKAKGHSLVRALFTAAASRPPQGDGQYRPDRDRAPADAE